MRLLRYSISVMSLDKQCDQPEALLEPIKKTVGAPLSQNHLFRRLAALQKNADAVLGRSWRGKDDGTLIRKVVGKAR